MSQRRTISGSRILITGATQGIGRSLGIGAAQRGASVLLNARTESDLEAMAAPLRASGSEVETVVGDVTVDADRHRMIDVAEQCFGGLDILINNAGIGATGHFAEAGEDRLRKIMEVNFFGLVELTRLAIPVLQKGNRPMIVNISSVAGKRAIPARSEYSASKYAVQGFTEALRAEMVRFGIDVLSVCPGLTATNFSQNMIENKAVVPMDHLRSMSPEQVAEATFAAIEKGKYEIVLTWGGKLLVGINRFFPRLVIRIMNYKVRSLYRKEIEEKAKRRQIQSRQPVGAG